jgi:hypothetical protein
MNFFKNALKMTMLVAAASLWLCRPVYGYIDPGTGSYVFQIIVAAFVAISFAVKVYWHKIKKIVGGLFRKKTNDSQ